MFRHKNDLSALFLLSANGTQIPYSHIYNLAVVLVRDGRMAADALHIVYGQITGYSHLRYAGINTGDNPVYPNKPDYAALADDILPKLRRLVKARNERVARELYEKDYVHPEILRGAFPEDLAEIGIMPWSRVLA